MSDGTDPAEGRGLVFISHPDKASGYAARASTIFKGHGYRTWLWDHDRPARGQLDVELYKAIGQCDYFAHICTRHSRRSEGQRNERQFAELQEKQPFFLLVFRPTFHLVFKPNFIPRDVKHRAIYNEVSARTFDDDCTKAVQRLLRQQKPRPEATQANEGSPIKLTVAESARVTESVVVVIEKGASRELA